jgi:hypothetical protein
LFTNYHACQRLCFLFLAQIRGHLPIYGTKSQLFFIHNVPVQCMYLLRNIQKHHTSPLRMCTVIAQMRKWVNYLNIETDISVLCGSPVFIGSCILITVYIHDTSMVMKFDEMLHHQNGFFVTRSRCSFRISTSLQSGWRINNIV